MYTKKQMAQWIDWGFPFSPEDQALAVDNEEFPDPSITGLAVEKAEHPLTGVFQQFQAIVYTDSSINNTQAVIQVELDEKIFVGTYQYKKGVFEYMKYRLGVSVTFPPPYSAYIYELKASIVSTRQIDKGKILSSKSINIKVDSSGNVAIYDGKPIEATNGNSIGDISISDLNYIIGNKRLFTRDNMRDYPNVYNMSHELFLKGLNENLNLYQITIGLRAAHFLAQIAHETVKFGTLEEEATGLAYNPPHKVAKILGNGPGDGPRFKGRGLMQLTGRTNYTNFSASYNANRPNAIDFTIEPNNTLLASDISIGTNSAAWYWQINASLNDNADQDDLIYIVYRVNGGFNGYNYRKELVIRALNQFKDSIDQSNLSKELGVYKIQDSRVYNNFNGTFIWGKYHDNFYKLDGTDKDDEIAKFAYQRVIDLYDSGKVKKTKDNKATYDKAKERLEAL